MRVLDLVPAIDNPRKWRENGEAELDESLEKFDLVEIPVVDFDNTIIAGHRRVERLIAAGRGEELIDVRKFNRLLTTEERKEYMLRSNLHQGEWDAEKLTEAFEGFDFEGLGMDVAGLPDPQKVLPSGEDDYVAPARLQTDIVVGDLFEFRKGDICHRLLCGDSTVVDDVEKLMGGRKANLYLTDPPYGVSYGDKNKFLNAIAKGNHIQEPIKNDHLKVDDCGQLWLDTFVLAETVMTNKASYYIFSAQGQDLMMMMMMIDKVFSLKHCLIWVKNNHVLGRADYNYKHEPFLFGWKKKGTHEFFGGFQTSVFEFPKPQKNDLHPTMKPVELFARLIENSTMEGYNVYDSFLGSGTTMIAAHQLSRNCYGMELDPHYCQVIVDRMLNYDPALEVTRNGNPYTPKNGQE